MIWLALVEQQSELSGCLDWDSVLDMDLGLAAMVEQIGSVLDMDFDLVEWLNNSLSCLVV